MVEGHMRMGCSEPGLRDLLQGAGDVFVDIELLSPASVFVLNHIHPPQSGIAIICPAL